MATTSNGGTLIESDTMPLEPPDLEVYMKEGGSTKTLSPASLEQLESLLKPSDPCFSMLTDPFKLPPPKPPDPCPYTATDTTKLPPSDRNACMAKVGSPHRMVEFLLPNTMAMFLAD